MSAITPIRSDVPLVPGVTMPDGAAIRALWREQAERFARLKRAWAVVQRGEINGNAKLTAEQVYEIRERYDAGTEPLDVIGADYGVSEACVRSIGQGRTWSHLPERPARVAS